MVMRRHRWATAGLALIPVLGMATTASAGDSSGKGWKKVHVSFTATNQEVTPLDFTCDLADATVCVGASKITNVTQTGDLQGSTLQANAFGTTAAGVIAYNVSGTFIGSVKGCGTGTFAYSGRGLLDAELNGETVYQIAKGSGTADLAGIGGTITGNDSGGFDAVLRCKRH
jgi:hypothetical protein